MVSKVVPSICKVFGSDCPDNRLKITVLVENKIILQYKII